MNRINMRSSTSNKLTLRDRILENIYLQDSRNSLPNQSINRNLKAVSCKFLTGTGKPAYNFHLSHPNGTTNPQCPCHMAPWSAGCDPESEHDQLVDFLWSQRQYPPLPFAVTIHQSAYLPRHKGHFKELLSSRNALSLVHMDVHPPMRIIKNMHFPEAPFTLDNLHLAKIRLGSDWASEWCDRYGQFIQNIQKGSDKIKEMHVYDIGITRWPMPKSIQNMKLPETLARLILYQVGDPRVLQIISKCYLPVLTELEINVVGEYIQNGVVMEVLKNIQSTLKLLRLSGICKGKHFRNITSEWMVQLPGLPKLKHLYIFGNDWHLEDIVDGDKNAALRSLPELAHLQLPETPLFLLQLMDRYEPFVNVVDLQAEITEDNVFSREEELWYSDISRMASITNWKLERISNSFPNLTSLELKICGNEISRIQYIFSGFPHLRHLTLRWGCRARTYEEATDIVDGLITGCTGETIKAFREKVFDTVPPSEWSIPAIRWLTKLQSLRLSVHWIRDRGDSRSSYLAKIFKRLTRAFRSRSHVGSPHSSESLLITDLSFRHGFLWMPSLTELHINASAHTSFQYHRQPYKDPSPEVLEIWRKQTGKPVQFSIF